MHIYTPNQTANNGTGTSQWHRTESIKIVFDNIITLVPEKQQYSYYPISCHYLRMHHQGVEEAQRNRTPQNFNGNFPEPGIQDVGGVRVAGNEPQSSVYV